MRIPKLRAGSFFPSLLERRRRVDQSLFAVIMEAYLHGTRAWQPGMPLDVFCRQLITSLTAEPQLNDMCALAIRRLDESAG